MKNVLQTPKFPQKSFLFMISDSLGAVFLILVALGKGLKIDEISCGNPILSQPGGRGNQCPWSVTAEKKPTWTDGC